MYGHPDKSVVSVRHWICYYIWSIIFKGKKALLVYSLKKCIYCCCKYVFALLLPVSKYALIAHSTYESRVTLPYFVG